MDDELDVSAPRSVGASDFTHFGVKSQILRKRLLLLDRASESKVVKLGRFEQVLKLVWSGSVVGAIVRCEWRGDCQ